MIENNLKQVNERIKNACRERNIDNKLLILLAVSKRQTIESIKKAYQLGQQHFGENYLSEALEKQILLTDYPIIWHYIGSIQSNKTKKIAENFAWVHSVDSLKIATRLSNQRPDNLPPLNMCLQINIDNEDTKSGFLPDTDGLSVLAQTINELPHINLRGLMCIPSPKQNKADEIATFSRMNELLQRLNTDGLNLDTLSMGMSDDLESAIGCGATMVRVGTAIFGQRT